MNTHYAGLVLCLAAGVLAGYAEATPAAPPAVPVYRLVAARANRVFTDREPIEIRIDASSNAPAAGERLRLVGEDAWGRKVFERSVKTPEPGGSRTVQLDADGRRYLYLRLTTPAEPAATNSALSLVVMRAPAAAPDQRFGFNTDPRLSPMVRRLGACWVRTHLTWDQAAENQPVRSAGIDRTVAAIQASDCAVFGISSYSVPWASVYAPDDTRNMRDIFSVPRPGPWDAYVTQAARTIRSRVTVFEVWNEPNMDMFWASVPNTFDQRLDDYAALLKRTYAIMKREAPDLRVTNGSLVNTRSDGQFRYFDGLLARGCGESFDILNLHYYRGGAAPEASTPQAEDGLEAYLRRFHDTLTRAHLDKPVWMTEIGWSSTDTGWGFCTEFEQMCYVIRAQVLCFASGVETVLWFKLEGEPFGIFDETHGPKPALAAYAQLVNALKGRAYQTALARDDCRVYVFADNSGDAVAVAWAVKPAPWRLPEAFRATTCENALGEPVAIPRHGNPLALTEAPLFIYGRWTAAVPGGA